MLDITFILDSYDGEYKNANEWLKGEGASKVARMESSILAINN